MLVLGSLGIVSVHFSVWLAFIAGLVILVAEGFVFARAEKLGALGTTVIVTANLAMGLLLVALKFGISH
jgi:asparagine N-glycosylation enzyme membrane subunit Stt3